MNTDIVNARWNEIRGDVQKRWGRLTNSDLDQVQGQFTQLVGLVQDRYGYSARKARREVNRFLNQYGMSTDEMQRATNSVLAAAQRTLQAYPLAFVAGGLVLALVLVGFVWKPFNR